MSDRAEPDSSPAIDVRDLWVTFPTTKDEPNRVLEGLDLQVPRGQFVVIVGPSGCGKSTLLNAVAGFVPAQSGKVTVFDKDVSPASLPLGVGYLTQDDTLLPWRTAVKNVELALELAGASREERHQRARDELVRVGLADALDTRPGHLSGGMRRRVLLARTLVTRPQLLLMDEPFASLDALLRVRMQGELLRLLKGGGATVLYVTHDLVEAAVLADRVLVFSLAGHIVLDRTVTFDRPDDVADAYADDRVRDLQAELWEVLEDDVRAEG